MRFPKSVVVGLACVLLGCNQPTIGVPVESDNQGPIRVEARRPTYPSEAVPVSAVEETDISFETAKDKEFAEFVRKTAGSMIEKLAVGVEQSGKLRVQLGEVVSPEDTLPLTKSLLAGARKNFPSKAFTLSVFDPKGAPILRAFSHPDQGVRYEVVNGDDQRAASNRPAARDPFESGTARTRAATDQDEKFASWAMKTGRDFLRYVESDLERNGRLWFGINRDVKPEDVKQLTQSLLEGARSEFPGKPLSATAFDPDGERIGRAVLDRQGRVEWTE